VSASDPCVIRDGKMTWYFDGVMSHCLGKITHAEALDVARACDVRIYHSVIQSQATFARDVAMERFGLARGHLGLWFCQVAKVPIWARF